MFTGLILDIGTVRAVEGGRYAIATGMPPASIKPGASIACDGVCLTATEIAADGTGALFHVDVSNETLSKTTLGRWRQGTKVNIEPALAAGDRLGGHVVTGHVDGLVTIVDMTPDGASLRFVFDVPEHLARFIAPKGSVALDGTSLTVNEVMGTRFGVNLIPHTLTATTWGSKKPGDLVNLEVDLFARYVARLLEFRP